MSMVGLGSVSRAVLSAADVPVAVIRKDMVLGSMQTVSVSSAQHHSRARSGHGNTVG